jgi:hypothetical protein
VLLDVPLTADQQRQAEIAERVVSAMVANQDVDELLPEVEAAFDTAARSSFWFAAGYFVGMQHLSRALHFESPDRCPV